MNRYFQIITDSETKLPTGVIELSDSAARSRADKGPHWFILRTGTDTANPVGFHACDLNSNQHAQLNAYRAATPGCALPADWNDDYPNDEAAAAQRFAGGGYEVPLSRKPVARPTSGGVGEYIAKR